jgi:hypothetical protein
MNRIIQLVYSTILILALLFVNQVEAKTQVINLTVAYKQVDFTGTPALAITVNIKFPAPFYT